MLSKNLEKKFQKLKKQWINETACTSSMVDIVENKNYQAIIKMGMCVLPIILKDMQKEPKWWFEALREITGEDPATEDMSGYLDKLTYAWLKWGEEKGYC